MEHENNYELAESVIEVFSNNIMLPKKETNACLSCKNATWFNTGKVSAHCSKLNTIVFEYELMIPGQKNFFQGISVCSGNPNFKPEE